MATPRSAGRVLIRPLGDYNAATTYEMLDAVEYEGSTYLCKQTSTGNLPTNKTYWQKMVSVGADDFMAIDGSNADKLIFDNNDLSFDFVDTITKPAGDNQVVTMTKTVSSNGDLSADAVAARFKSKIGDTNIRTYATPRIYIIFDAVSVSGNVVTITGHLKEDDSAAIDRGSTQLLAYDYTTSSSALNIIGGRASSVDGKYNAVFGEKNSVKGSASVVNGNNNVISSIGDGNMASGSYNYVSGNYDAHAFGALLEAKYSRQFVCGLSNDNKADTLFEVGGGTMSGSRENAFEVYSDGYVSFDNGTDLYKFAKSGGKDGYYDTNHTFHAFSQPLYLTQSVTLSTSADTTVTFSNAAITTDSMIDVYTDTYGVNPSDVAVTTGTCTLTFAKVSTAQTISARIEIKNV